MSRVATTELGLAPAVANNNGNFDVFASLRDDTGGEDFSSGAGEAGGADTDEAASSLDLVAVASGEAELNTVTNSKSESKETSAPVNPEQCQKYGTIACVGCIFAQDCQDRQAAMMAGNTEVQPGEQLSTLEQLLREDEALGEIVWAQPSPDDFDSGELSVADSPRVVETGADKPDGPTEKVTLQEREGKTSTSETVGTSSEDVDTEVAEVSSPPAEAKPHVIDATSDADDDNKQLTLELLDTSVQAETVSASLAINKDTQTSDENSNPLKNETVYYTVSDDKVTASVVENTYDGDKTTAPSSVKIPSIERQKEEDLVIAGSKSANSEPSRAAENDESATPVSEQQHLAARFEAVKVDESAIKEPIYNSGTKVPIDTQPSEINIDAAADYNNFVKSIDSVNAEQPKYVTPTAANVSPSQEQGDAVNVSAKYETNETSTEEVVNTVASIPAKEQPDQPAIVSLSTQDIVEHGESSLSVREESPVDRSPTRPDVINKPMTHEVIEATCEAGETIELEAINITMPVDAATVSEGGKNQIDLSPELNEELVVDKRVYEAQTFLVEQFDHNDAAVKYDYGEDNEAWAEEDVVFLVEQQSPAVEPEVPSAEAVTVALQMETTTAREEVDDLKLSVDDEIGVDMDSVGQLDNSKVASMPEITNDYEPVEQIVIPASPAIEPIRDVELDEPVVEISEERIMPREEHDSIVMEASEKSDLPRVDDEVKAIITDTSDVEPAIDLPEAQEELIATEVSEAVESELDEQNDLAVVSAVDGYGYNSETSAVSDNVLVVKSCPSSGLWPDDSRLNPEEESASTAQSSADDASLVSRLVGMFVVAMCVVRGRQARAIPNS